MKNINYEFETTTERKLFVSDKELAEQLAKTNISASIFVEQLKDPRLAMLIMRACAGMNLRFPCPASILKSGIVVFIKTGLRGTYKGRKERRAALRKTQQKLAELGIQICRQQIERIFKAGKWVQ